MTLPWFSCIHPFRTHPIRQEYLPHHLHLYPPLPNLLNPSLLAQVIDNARIIGPAAGADPVSLCYNDHYTYDEFRSDA
jgi:hypothetical protein